MVKSHIYHGKPLDEPRKIWDQAMKNILSRFDNEKSISFKKIWLCLLHETGKFSMEDFWLENILASYPGCWSCLEILQIDPEKTWSARNFFLSGQVLSNSAMLKSNSIFVIFFLRNHRLFHFYKGFSIHNIKFKYISDCLTFWWNLLSSVHSDLG